LAIDSLRENRIGFGTRSLVSVFGVLTALFAGTTVLASWYSSERLSRASEYFKAGQRLEARDEAGEAIEAYRNALEISPKSEYRLALAQALIRSGRPEGASAYLTELLRSDIASGEPNLLLARIAAKEGRVDTAVNYYQRAIYGYWPRDAQKNRLAARWELIALLESAHMQTQATAQLLELSEQAPGDAPVLIQVAKRLLANGAPSQAAELFREALKIQTGNGEAEAGLAEAQLAMAHYVDAQAAFRKAIREGEDNEEVRRAYETVNQVLALDPVRHDLSPIERYRRSLLLLERSAALVSACGVSTASPNALLDQAKQAETERRPHPPDLESSIDANIHLAQQIYALKGNCAQSDPALARVFASINSK
jgi:tetratricopeptide (TPR) repeat protein